MELEIMSELERMERSPQLERGLSEEDRAYHRVVKRDGLGSRGRCDIQL